MFTLDIDPQAPCVPLEIFHVYFSPHSAHAVMIDGLLYPTVEHAYQASRYDSISVREVIRKQPSPLRAWEVSKEYKGMQNSMFRVLKHKRAVMRRLCRFKLAQHADVHAALRSTGNVPIKKIITTYPPGDEYWCVTPDGRGQNEFGKIWMELRAQLQPA